MSRNPITPECLKTEVPLQVAQFTTDTCPNAVLDVLDWFEQLHSDHIPSRAWADCQTVLIEGIDNVIRHAHKSLPAQTPILTKIAVYQDAIEIQIWDQGVLSTCDALLQQTPEHVDVMAESGRGLMLMHRVADYLNYACIADERNRLLVICSLS